MKKLLLSSIALGFVSMALYSLGAGQANQNNYTQGVINGNGGSAGALAFYSAASNSTTIGPDSALTDASNALTYTGTGGIVATVGGLTAGDGSTTAGVLTLKGSSGGAPTITVNAAGTQFQASTNVQAPKFATTTNCAQGGASGTTSPAACASAATGVIAIPASQTTYTVNTTNAGGSSRILVQQTTDNTSITTATCNTGAISPILSGRVVGTSFTISLTSVASVTCIEYWIFN